MKTPWGPSQTVERLSNGITIVSTAGHGGAYVPLHLLHKIPREQQEWAAYWSGDRRWYEEDCCFCSVVLAFPELFPDANLPQALSVVTQCLDSHKKRMEAQS